jgi:hypothetical protein
MRHETIYTPIDGVLDFFDGYQKGVKTTIWYLGAIATWLFATE